MNKMFKKVLSLVLCLTMMAGITLPVLAANDLGVTFSATLDKPTITESNVAQTVTMQLSANQAITLNGLQLTVTKDAALELTSVSGADAAISEGIITTNLENGSVMWEAKDVEDDTVTNLLTIVFTVPANTPAGTYTVGVENMELTQGNKGTVWETGASASATLTIEGNAAAEGYSAGLSAAPSVTVGQQASVNVAVNHVSDSAFAAAEMTFTYDNTKLTFNEAASTLHGAEVTDNAGTLSLAVYGADKNCGNGAFVLVFDAIADGVANVALTAAAFSNQANAVSSDLIAASSLNPASLALTVDKKQFSVTLPTEGILTGNEAVVDGADYVFGVENPYYNYTISATMGEETATVIDNGDGTYTIENVTGDLVVTATRTPKQFNVTNGEQTDTATYGTDYHFNLPEKEGFTYSLNKITIGGVVYTGVSVADKQYTIAGTDITGPIVITWTETEVLDHTVTVSGTGAGSVHLDKETVNDKESVTLTLTLKEEGYLYTVTATMGGIAVDVIDNGNDSYTVNNITGDVEFTVTKTVDVSGVSVGQYLTANGTIIWLVKNDCTLAEGKIPTYDGVNMFWSEKYGAYYYLVIAATLSAEEAGAKVGIVTGTAVSVDYGMDVNKTGKVDANDAQLTYNMYNAKYSDFTTVEMEKFLRADVNGDSSVNVTDAAAIINDIIS